MGTVAARELEIISGEQATQRVQSILKTLEKLKTWKGFFFNFYDSS
jgi:hypothetical protein